MFRVVQGQRVRSASLLDFCTFQNRSCQKLTSATARTCELIKLTMTPTAMKVLILHQKMKHDEKPSGAAMSNISLLLCGAQCTRTVAHVSPALLLLKSHASTCPHIVSENAIKTLTCLSPSASTSKLCRTVALFSHKWCCVFKNDLQEGVRKE